MASLSAPAGRRPWLSYEGFPLAHPEKREPVACAGAVVRDAERRLLLVRRANEPGRGLWSLPGGRIEAGETPEEAAAREVFEETGLRVAIGEHLCRVGFGPYVVDDFVGTVTGGTLRAGDDALDAAWFSPEELRALPLSADLLDELERMGVL